MIACPKSRPWRSWRYKKYIASLPCAIYLCTSPSEPHHESGLMLDGGMGQKTSDSCCVPLCRKHHIYRHNEGWKRFWEGYDPQLMVLRYLTDYLKGIKGV